MDHNLVGRTLGKYKITRRIARGGMADVYKAKSTSLDRDVAIKIMHSHLTHTEQYLTRFKREAQSIAQLRHAHIIQLYDFDVEGDIHYMVIEFIKGGTLEQLLQERGALSVSRTLDIVIPLADALVYAHNHGLIHRDIKPNNIMFTDLQFTHPILTDFGITKIHNDVSVTEDGQALGTPGYMGPEVGLDQPRDKRSDIYSMGALLYRMLTGRLPFIGKSSYDIFRQQISNPIPDPRHFAENLPDALVNVIYKSLAQNPDDRYASASDFKKALEEIRGDVPQTNTDQQAGDISRADLRALVTGETGLTGFEALKPDDPSHENGSTSFSSWKLIPILIVLMILVVAGFLLSKSLPETAIPTTSQVTQTVAIASEATVRETPIEIAANTSPTLKPVTPVRSTPTKIIQPTLTRMASATSLPSTVVTLEPVIMPSRTRQRVSTATFTNTATIEPTATLKPPTLTATATSTSSMTPLPIPQELEIDKALIGQLAAGETSRSYVLSASPTQAIFISLDSPGLDSGLKIEIKDQASGDLVAALYPRVTAACVRISPSERIYVVRISSDETALEHEFHLEVIAANPQQMDCPTTSAGS